MTDADNPQALIPLTPAVFHIALALARKPLHGYGVMQEVERFTEGAVCLGPGTLYRSIQRMVRDKLIEEVPVGPVEEEHERRRYYRLTPFGRQVTRAEAERLRILVQAAALRGMLDRDGRKAKTQSGESHD